jgi:hypothetical protein
MKTLTLIASLTLLTSALVQGDPPEFVQLARAKNDAKLTAKVVHHLAIKAFLVARDQGDTRAERLLGFLLNNGYSIDDFSKAYFVINAPVVPPEADFVRMMRSINFPEDKLQRDLGRRRAALGEVHKKFIREWTGITDEDSVTFLYDLANESKDGLKIQMFQVPVDGERLLTDADWLTNVYKVQIATFKGERRHLPDQPQHLP